MTGNDIVVIVATKDCEAITNKWVASFNKLNSKPCGVIAVDSSATDSGKKFITEIIQPDNERMFVICRKLVNGLPGAYNVGAETAISKFGADKVLLFCHNDVIFRSDFIDRFVSSYNNTNIVMTKNLYPSFGFNATDEDIEKAKDKLSCGFFCFGVKASFWKGLGGFNEAYAPMFFFDDEFALMAGEANVGTADAFTWHQGGAYLAAGNSNCAHVLYQTAYYRNREYIYEKFGKKALEDYFGPELYKELQFIDAEKQTIIRNKIKEFMILKASFAGA